MAILYVLVLVVAVVASYRLGYSDAKLDEREAQLFNTIDRVNGAIKARRTSDQASTPAQFCTQHGVWLVRECDECCDVASGAA